MGFAVTVVFVGLGECFMIIALFEKKKDQNE